VFSAEKGHLDSSTKYEALRPQSHRAVRAIRRQYDVYDTIRPSHLRGNPFGRYALLQYEYLVNRKRLTRYLVDEKKIRENSTRRKYSIHSDFNKSVELGSSVVPRELHHGGESFRSYYRMTQESLKLSLFLN